MTPAAPGPFARPAAVRTLAVLVVLAVAATVWVGVGRQRDAEPTIDDLVVPTTPTETRPPGLPTAPAPERGDVAALTADDATSGPPDGWAAEAGAWSRDAEGLRVELAPAGEPALAVTTVEALPWATVSVTGTGGPGWGMVFGYTGPDDHFVVTVDGTTARVLRVQGGTETEVSTSEVTAGDEVLVAVDVTERNVAIHVGTTLLPSVQVPTVDAARRVGVRAAAGADVTSLRWSTLGVRARVALGEPLVARGQEVTEMTPDEARLHLGP